MKKAFAILMITVLLFSLSISAFAADNGSITITNTTIGETYTLYKIFGATIDTSNTPVSIAYTYNGTLTANDYFDQDASGNITIKAAGKDAADATHLSAGAITFLSTLATGTPLKTEVATANSVTFSNLDYGFYYIGSTLGKKAVSVDSTTPHANVIDKNQGPAWIDPEKKTDNVLGKYIILADGSKVTQNSVNFGDTVNFEVSFNATNYIGEKQVRTYYLSDTIAPGFEIVQSSLEVYFDGAKKTAITDYTVDWSSDKLTFTVAAPWDNTDTAQTVKYEANTVFTVKYSAKLLNTAVIASTGNVNTAYFDYRIDSDTVADAAKPDAVPAAPFHKSTEKKTTTYTFALGMTKIDGEDKHRLTGAEFTLKCGDTVIKAKETSTTGVYEYDKNGTVTQFKTNAQGVLVIKGLAEGSYSLTEAVAPKGYNRALNPATFTFSIANKDQYVEEHSTSYDSKGAVTTVAANVAKTVSTDYDTNVLGLIFENQRGVELPVTGGMGTRMFYLVGGGLVFVAILLLLTKKRLSAGK